MTDVFFFSRQPGTASCSRHLHCRLRSAASIGDSAGVSLADVSLVSLDGIPIISDEVVANKEDVDGADEDPAGDYIVLADEAVLTVNGGANSVRMRIGRKGLVDVWEQGYT